MNSVAEIVHGRRISDAECLRVYHDALRRLHRADGDGLYYPEAFDAAHAAGWLPGAKRLVRADLSDLRDQPLLGGYVVNSALDNVSDHGCLDHQAAGTAIRGYHAMAIVALGDIRKLGDLDCVWVENSWGLRWGWRGIGVMTADLHARLCREMWRIER